MAPVVLLVDPTVPGVLIVGNYSTSGVTISKDGGATWTWANAGLAGSAALHMSWDANGDTLLLGARDGVFRRHWSPGGKGDWLWADISYNLAGQPVVAVLPPTLGGRDIVAGTVDGVYVGDGTSPWREVTGISFRQRRVEFGALAWGGPRSSWLYVGTLDGLYVTRDGGSSWEERSAGLANTAVNCILPLDSTRLLLGTCDGLYATYDGGRTWCRRATGLVASQCYFLAFDTTRTPTRVWTGVDGAGVYYSDNWGVDWVDAEADIGELQVSSRAIAPTSPPALYAAYIRPAGPPRYFLDGVMVSRDAGLSWLDVSGPMRSLLPLCVVADPLDSDVLYCGTMYGGLFKSPDGGNSWHPSNGGLPTGIVELVAVDPTNPQVVYAGVRSRHITEPHGLYISTDGGEQWAPAFPAYLSETWREVMDLAINPVNPRTLFAAISTLEGVHRSHDQGRSWEPVNRGIRLGSGHYVVSVAIDPVDTNVVYAAGTELYVSYDAGANWQPMEAGLPPHFGAVTKIRVDPKDPSRIYAASDGSGVLVYHRTKSRVHRERNEEVPTAYYLAQNFPNPFNASTLLRFGLPKQSSVLMEVFSVTGELVCTLVNERRGPGHYTVLWNGRDQQGARVASGVYLCRLRAGEFVDVKKMMLLY
ncbi:MAG: T9SS type A sorting domain-containing protein [Calditrichaeota bacterium]|nr:T9SS type A sorting domain-containing protein [Calditrichota bacterium]